MPLAPAGTQRKQRTPVQHLTADKFAAAVAKDSGASKRLVKHAISIIQGGLWKDLVFTGRAKLLDIAELVLKDIPKQRAEWIMVMGRAYRTKPKPARRIVKAFPGARFK